ncbi:hypothetical protein GCM10022214_83800 [Actinomadura miaoliensis]|uniref:Uncharacterized protein n=1 Tax=Actinomadura miaoliensis TaxID=430685 RepID=A0ABP7X512_9ACTN
MGMVSVLSYAMVPPGIRPCGPRRRLGPYNGKAGRDASATGPSLRPVRGPTGATAVSISNFPGQASRGTYGMSPGATAPVPGGMPVIWENNGVGGANGRGLFTVGRRAGR